jgi:hypothetical protein
MTAITGLDWDAWRNAYHGLTYAQQQAFHSAIYEQYPEQRHYNADLVARAIEQVQPCTVVELGGWDGELAHTMLDQHPTIQQWTNVELCKEAAQAGHARHPRYHAPTLSDWYWTKGPWHCDLFVASHTIEHLTITHLNETLAATHAGALFLDAPLHNKSTNWRGHTATHILECGWIGVDRLCDRHGYTLAWAEDHSTDPSSGEHARACLYLKDTA